jgi:hypothetical protein
MTSKTRTRITRLVAALVAVLAAALVAGSLGGGQEAVAQGKAQAKRQVSQAELAFRNEMRRLWEDHIVWTRLAIISLTTDAPDTGATVGRLLENQDEIGAAIAPFYGEAAGDELARLLRDHILVAADLVAAARAGDAEAVADAQARWGANADEIAAFLAAANPRAWNEAVLRASLEEHLRMTTDEAVARLTGDWEADVAAYDAIHAHILGFADVLSTGIVRQFPGRFR